MRTRATKYGRIDLSGQTINARGSPHPPQYEPVVVSWAAVADLLAITRIMGERE